MTAEIWRPFEEADAGEANAAMVRQSFEMVDIQWRLIIEHSLTLLKDLVDRDATALNAVDDNVSSQSCELYVRASSLEAYWEGNKPQETLTFVMESRAGDSNVPTFGDRLEISLPAEPSYVYPQPVDTEAVEPTAYLRYIPAPDKGLKPTRFVMQRDDLSHGAYRLYKYVTQADEGESQEVFDDFSDIKMNEVFSRRIPEEVTDVTTLLAHFGNFTIIPQTLITPVDKIIL